MALSTSDRNLMQRHLQSGQQPVLMRGESPTEIRLAREVTKPSHLHDYLKTGSVSNSTAANIEAIHLLPEKPRRDFNPLDRLLLLRRDKPLSHRPWKRFGQQDCCWEWRTGHRLSATTIFHEAAEPFTKDAANRFLYGWNLIPRDTFASNP